MKYIEHPALIEEWIQNLDTAAYEKNIHKDEKLPSMKKKIDSNYKTECWPKIRAENLIWLPFIDIMDFTTDSINNDKNLLPSLLKILQCLRLNVGGIKNKKMI